MADENLIRDTQNRFVRAILNSSPSESKAIFQELQKRIQERPEKSNHVLKFRLDIPDGHPRTLVLGICEIKLTLVGNLGLGSLAFKDTEFLKDVHLSDVKVGATAGGSVRFNNCKFKGNVLFSNTDFQNGDIHFDGADQNLKVFLEANAHMSALYIKGGVLEKLDVGPSSSLDFLGLDSTLLSSSSLQPHMSQQRSKRLKIVKSQLSESLLFQGVPYHDGTEVSVHDLKINGLMEIRQSAFGGAFSLRDLDFVGTIKELKVSDSQFSGAVTVVAPEFQTMTLGSSSFLKSLFVQSKKLGCS